MIIDITAHKAFRKHHPDAVLEDALAPLVAQMEEVITNMAISFDVACDTIRAVKVNRTPELVGRLANQRILIGNLLHNLNPLEPQLAVAGDEFMRRYRDHADNLRRVAVQMDQELARPSVMPKLHNPVSTTAYNMGQILASITLFVTGIAMAHVFLG